MHFVCIIMFDYLCHRLLSGEGIMSLSICLVMLCVCVCVRRISLGGEGNALYPVLSTICT